jgi:hypothetical protein
MPALLLQTAPRLLSAKALHSAIGKTATNANCRDNERGRVLAPGARSRRAGRHNAVPGVVERVSRGMRGRPVE